jgi:DNA-binding XRE family transcriptional regulator
MRHLIEHGSDLGDWCIRNSYTKTDLASELGVTRQTLFNWSKSDKRVPRVLTLALYGLEKMPIEMKADTGSKIRKQYKRQ